MEIAAGAVLIPIGLMVLAFGGVPRRGDEDAAGRLGRLVKDAIFRWAMGLCTLAFGLGLVFERVHFG